MALLIAPYRTGRPEQAQGSSNLRHSPPRRAGAHAHAACTQPNQCVRSISQGAPRGNEDTPYDILFRHKIPDEDAPPVRQRKSPREDPKMDPSVLESMSSAGRSILSDVGLQLRPGAYAIVRCEDEDFFRALNTEPARFGEAGGHAGLASQQPVLFAGEVEVSAGGMLERWKNFPGPTSSQTGLLARRPYLCLCFGASSPKKSWTTWLASLGHIPCARGTPWYRVWGTAR